jgi:hypothetical protein
MTCHPIASRIHLLGIATNRRRTWARILTKGRRSPVEGRRSPDHRIAVTRDPELAEILAGGEVVVSGFETALKGLTGTHRLTRLELPSRLAAVR